MPKKMSQDNIQRFKELFTESLFEDLANSVKVDESKRDEAIKKISEKMLEIIELFKTDLGQDYDLISILEKSEKNIGDVLMSSIPFEVRRSLVTVICCGLDYVPTKKQYNPCSKEFAMILSKNILLEDYGVNPFGICESNKMSTYREMDDSFLRIKSLKMFTDMAKGHDIYMCPIKFNYFNNCLKLVQKKFNIFIDECLRYGLGKVVSNVNDYDGVTFYTDSVCSKLMLFIFKCINEISLNGLIQRTQMIQYIKDITSKTYFVFITQREKVCFLYEKSRNDVRRIIAMNGILVTALAFKLKYVENCKDIIGEVEKWIEIHNAFVITENLQGRSPSEFEHNSYQNGLLNQHYSLMDSRRTFIRNQMTGKLLKRI
uniref:Uncharacterized protein n=1 Tax=Parastrongyloides trichosuri TaxID=131310 RepID=A0A0N4Z059_PARTI